MTVLKKIVHCTTGSEGKFATIRCNRLYQYLDSAIQRGRRKGIRILGIKHNLNRPGLDPCPPGEISELIIRYKRRTSSTCPPLIAIRVVSHKPRTSHPWAGEFEVHLHNIMRVSLKCLLAFPVSIPHLDGHVIGARQDVRKRWVNSNASEII